MEGSTAISVLRAVKWHALEGLRVNSKQSKKKGLDHCGPAPAGRVHAVSGFPSQSRRCQKSFDEKPKWFTCPRPHLLCARLILPCVSSQADFNHGCCHFCAGYPSLGSSPFELALFCFVYTQIISKWCLFSSPCQCVHVFFGLNPLFRIYTNQHTDSLSFLIELDYRKILPPSLRPRPCISSSSILPPGAGRPAQGC